MPAVDEDLTTPDTRSTDAWLQARCPECSGQQMLIVRRVHSQATMNRNVFWLRCVNCLMGVVVNGKQMSPPPMPLDVPQGVEGDTLTTWNEARSCLSVGAFTASVMMCRKLLMHMAVEEGLPEKDDRDRAPNFFECIDHLQSEGVITKRNRKWVDRIKDIGNEANHDLASIDKDQATTVATFTRQLLHEVYELPYLEANT